MSDFIPKANGAKVGGLGPKAQRLQALREKAAAQAKGGAKPEAGAAANNAVKAKGSFPAAKKTAFNRKAV